MIKDLNLARGEFPTSDTLALLDTLETTYRRVSPEGDHLEIAAIAKALDDDQAKALHSQ